MDETRPGLLCQAWQRLCDVGVAGVLVPERSGGQGGGLTEAIDLARALSRQACPVPFLPSAVFATRLAEAAGAPALLAELATGDRVAAVAVGGVLLDGPAGLTLSGPLTDVLHGAEADVWLVAAPGPDGRLALVMLPRPDYEVVPTADPTRPVVQATVRDVPVTLLQDDCTQSLHQAALLAEVVRCAEVLVAAELILACCCSDRLLLRAAVSTVDHAAAAADVDGQPDLVLVRTAVDWTSRVAAHVQASPNSAAQRRFHLLRAQQGQAGGRPLSPDPPSHRR